MSKERLEGTDNEIPTNEIHAAFRDALRARHQWQQHQSTRLEHDAHEHLHDAVARYYEVLRPLLATSNATEELWTEVKLWPTGPKRRSWVACSNDGCDYNVAQRRLEQAGKPLGSGCPECAAGVLEPAEGPVVRDENGEVVYEWVEGLSSLDNIWDQQQTVEKEVSSALGSHTRTHTETLLLPPDRLRTIARKLDEAMQSLNLHATVDDSLPEGKLDA